MKKTLGVFLTLCAVAGAATRSDMLVSTDWLAQHLKDANLVVLHVAANRAAYDEGHVPGAQFVALGSIAINRDGIPNELPPVADLQKIFATAGVSNNSHVIVYSDGSVLPATRAYFTLDYLGLGDQTALLDGGLEKWKADGKSVTKDVMAAKAGNLMPKAKPDVVAQLASVNQMSENKSATLLDVRAAGNYSGERGSHIPGATNLYWMQDQVSQQDSSLKAEAALRNLYEAAGITPSKKVVTYCNSGMQASQTYFTLKYLGYDVQMYDGSMSEWNARKQPVEK